MTASLSAVHADRLVKLLGMLGSDHIGERATAAAKADGLVSELGLSWFNLIGPGISSGSMGARSCTSIEEMIDCCFARSDMLSAWEEDFLRGICGRQHLTEKQMRKLDQLVAQLQRRAAA